MNKNLLFLFLILGGCGLKKTPDEGYAYRFPFIKGCEEDVKAAEEYLNRVHGKDDFQVGLKTIYFDSGSYYASPISGVVEIYSNGTDFIDGMPAAEYIKSHAISIIASCSPEQKFSITLEDRFLKDVYLSLKSKSKVPLILQYGEQQNELIIFYNNNFEYNYKDEVNKSRQIKNQGVRLSFPQNNVINGVRLD